MWGSPGREGISRGWGHQIRWTSHFGPGNGEGSPKTVREAGRLGLTQANTGTKRPHLASVSRYFC